MKGREVNNLGRLNLKSKAGMTMVEVVISMSCAVLLSAGVYGVGIGVMRHSYALRIDTEVQCYAKEAVEEIIAIGLENLRKPNCSYLATTNRTNPSTNVEMERSVRVIWHDQDGAVVTSSDESLAYAEVHVDVTYGTLTGNTIRTITYSTLVN